MGELALHQLQGLDVYSDLGEEQLEVLLSSGPVVGQYRDDVFPGGCRSRLALLGWSMAHGETDELVSAVLLAVAVAGASQDEEDFVGGAESLGSVLYVDHPEGVFYNHLLLTLSFMGAEPQDVPCVAHNPSPCP